MKLKPYSLTLTFSIAAVDLDDADRISDSILNYATSLDGVFSEGGSITGMGPNVIADSPLDRCLRTTPS